MFVVRIAVTPLLVVFQSYDSAPSPSSVANRIRIWAVALALLGGLLTGCSGTGSNPGAEEEPRPEDDPPPEDVVDGYTSQPADIRIDGRSREWSSLSVRYDDSGDGSGTPTLGRLWIAHTEERLFLRLTVTPRINLEANNDLRLYIDADDDPTTGTSALGVGAELSWAFGGKQGQFRGTTIRHEDIGFASLPTVRADTFEITLDRSAQPGGRPLFPEDTIRVALSANGDRLPNGDGGLGYVLSDTQTSPQSPSLDRPTAADVRLLSYNVPYNFNTDQSTLSDPNVQESVRRILDATGPDVVGLQEMYDLTADEIEQRAETDLGLPDAWHWATEGNDLALGTEYAIDDTHAIAGAPSFPSAAFLLDTSGSLGRRLVVVLMHPKCCNDPGDNQDRQQTADGVAAFLRNVTDGTGPFGVDPNTPVVVAGDMNFVGDRQQRQTLLSGDIVNTTEFGSSAAPDWDGTSLLDTNPQQTGSPLHTTTDDPGSRFPPGRLDYAFTTDSVLEVVHEYVLNTSTLTQAQRSNTGLKQDDTVTASDHLPVVVDLALR